MEVKVLSKIFNGYRIRQRSSDGYLSATDMCKIYNTLFGNYKRLKQTKVFLATIAVRYKLSVDDIICVRQGGNITVEQGSWIHPMAAIHLAQWLDPVFALNVCEWVTRFIGGDLTLIKDIIANQEDRQDVQYLDTTSNDVKVIVPTQQAHDHKPTVTHGVTAETAQDDNSTPEEQQLAWQRLEFELERACTFIEQRIKYIQLRELDPSTWNT